MAAELVERTGCRVTGIDQSAQMLAVARERLAALSPDLAGRIELVQGEAEHLPFPEASFGGLTVTYLLRYVEDPAATLRELVRVVRPGGTVASLEFGVPSFPPARWGWTAYTAVGLPVAGLLAGREWYRVGRFLRGSILDFYARYPLSRLLDLHRTAGLRDLRLRRLSFGGGVVIWGTVAA